ncbi:MAG: CerR family C-terminal domain-containing protein [Planctomycetota bacterium]|jgi:AcrR family transcriptional regulator
MAISQENSAVGSSAKGVRDRLLSAAEELFAERGFDGTSVRDLAAAAGCNIASVNYYFGGKEKLYVEIWRRHLLLLRDTRLASIEKVMADSGGEPGLEDLLRSFAHSFIGPLVEEKGGPRLIKLMVREMIDPHLPASMFGDDVIKPTLFAMQQALSKACPDLPEAKVPLVLFSLIGQLIHTIRVKTMLNSMDDEVLAMFEPVKVIDHIVAFSAAGIKAYAGGEAK